MITLRRLFRGRRACPCAIFSSILFSATLATASGACVTSTAGGAWQNTAMTSQTGTFTATFDATPSASPTNSVIGLSNGAQTAYANFACLARFNPTGDIDAYNGSAAGYAAASTIPYSAGVSYHFRLVVNVSAKTYSVYVTPAGGSEVTVGLNYAFRIADTSLNYWGVYVSSTSGGTGNDTVCNFSTGGTITTYAITASAGSGGSISPSGTVTVNQAANQSFTITPSSGFNISSVTVDGVNVGIVTSYTFSNVQANHTINAAFQQQSSSEGPFGGTPADIPGTVQAENYDTGGQGVAYNVSSINGTDNGYRSDGVDLEATSDTGGGVDLGWTTGGQWFKYTVNVATAGTYTVSFRVAAPNAVTDAFHLANSSGTNLSGNVNLPATGGYQTWATVTANVTLPAGQQVLTLDEDNINWNINYASFAQQIQTFTITASAGSGGSISPSGNVVANQGASQSFTITPNSGFNVSSVTVDGVNMGTVTAYTFSNVQANHTISAAFQQQSSEGPFGGTPAAIPGTVQAENYDTGGQGVAYNVASINGSDNGYRSDGVDLEVTSDTGGGVDLGWTSGGQWFKYTVKVSTAGTYTVSFRVAAPTAVTDAFHLSNSSGTNLSGSVNVPATGGWQTWATVTANVTLPAGQQILTMNQDNGGWNINYLGFATSGGTVATPVFSPGGGSYTSAQNVTITSATGGASIRYTLDGSTPTSTAGTIYSGPVNISSTATLKAVAYESGFTTSAVTSGTYSFNSGSITTTGTVNFHLLLGAGSSQDSLTLTGDNYTDLIMSNTIAGVLYGHLIEEYYPGIQFNKDYLYGSVFGELLQENIATQDYMASSTLLDPSPNQQAVMGAGQGGPYQINNYAIDMVAGSYTPAGHSMINYIAVQKNIGYTMATASTQYSKPTPPSFNNKYYGPLLCAYFHYNDFVALNIIGKGPGGWTTPWEPAYDNALANFVNLPNSFLDMLLNAAYNQGYYGGLVANYSSEGATATASTVASVDSYSSVWGNSSTYVQYPYQVHYYMDQIYDNPIPTTSLTTIVTPANHLTFNMATFGNVFSNVIQTMDYSNGTNAAQYFTAAQAQTALNSALAQQGVSGSATLDFSNASDRAKIYAVIDSALSSLESTSGMKFNSTTNSQL
jgi:hypothetical protein